MFRDYNGLFLRSALLVRRLCAALSRMPHALMTDNCIDFDYPQKTASVAPKKRLVKANPRKQVYAHFSENDAIILQNCAGAPFRTRFHSRFSMKIA